MTKKFRDRKKKKRAGPKLLKLSKRQREMQRQNGGFWDKSGGRGRVYTSADGRKLTGVEATNQSRRDRDEAVRNPRDPMAVVLDITNVRRAFIAAKRDREWKIRSGQSELAKVPGKHSDYDAFRKLSVWGVPPAVEAVYTRRGVTGLFDWQIEALNAALTPESPAPDAPSAAAKASAAMDVDSIEHGKPSAAPNHATDSKVAVHPCALDGQNLIYSAPTSGGKSLVAEILMLRRLLDQRARSHPQLLRSNAAASAAGSTESIGSRKALVLLPYAALVGEKLRDLREKFEPVNLRVEEFRGPKTGDVDSADVLVATFEKANSIVNGLTTDGTLASSIATLVIDELHMIGSEPPDPNCMPKIQAQRITAEVDRGALIELILIKVQSQHRIRQQQQSDSGSTGLAVAGSTAAVSNATGPATAAADTDFGGLQIVGMSATLPNVRELARWLKAALFETDFRPVPLKQYVMYRAAPGYMVRDISNWDDSKVTKEVPAPLPEHNKRVGELSVEDQHLIARLCHQSMWRGKQVLVFCSAKVLAESTAKLVAYWIENYERARGLCGPNEPPAALHSAPVAVTACAANPPPPSAVVPGLTATASAAIAMEIDPLPAVAAPAVVGAPSVVSISASAAASSSSKQKKLGARPQSVRPPPPPPQPVPACSPPSSQDEFSPQSAEKMKQYEVSNAWRRNAQQKRKEQNDHNASELARQREQQRAVEKKKPPAPIFRGGGFQTASAVHAATAGSTITTNLKPPRSIVAAPTADDAAAAFRYEQMTDDLQYREWRKPIQKWLDEKQRNASVPWEQIAAPLPLHPKYEERQKLIADLSTLPEGIDSILEQTIPHGVAFHHASLTQDEKDKIETAYCRGVLSCLVATSTLGTGVNLPCQRVIFHGPVKAVSAYTTSEYRQMSGRAGRLNLDASGESWMVCSNAESGWVRRMMTAPLPKVKSQLLLPPAPSAAIGGKERTTLERLLLDVIASTGSTGTSVAHALAVIENSLMAATNPREVAAPYIRTAWQYLMQHQFIELTDAKTGSVRATKLGLATFAAGLPPAEGYRLYCDLSKTNTGALIPTSSGTGDNRPSLHVCYHLAPLYQSLRGLIKKKDKTFWYLYNGDRTAHQIAVSERVGVNEALMNNIREDIATACEQLAFRTDDTVTIRRYVIGMILQEILSEEALTRICTKFGCLRGDLQSLVGASGTFAAQLKTFCDALGYRSLASLFGHFQERLDLTGGAKTELKYLMAIQGVKSTRARALFAAGLRTVADVGSEKSLAKIVAALDSTVPFQAATKSNGDRKQTASAAATGASSAAAAAAVVGAPPIPDVSAAARRADALEALARSIQENARKLHRAQIQQQQRNGGDR